MHAVRTLSLDGQPFLQTVEVEPVVTLEIARGFVSLVEVVCANHTDFLDVGCAWSDRYDFDRFLFFF